MTEAAVELNELVKRFPGVTALDHVSLSIPRHSVFALLGSNGAGKSTGLSILVNLLQPTAGEARVLGKDSRTLCAEDFKRIGYVSEDRRLPPWLNAREFLDFLRPLYPDWDRDFEAKLLETLDIPVTRNLKHMSRGEKMKVRLLSNMAYRPRLLILDEPFSGLDPVVREELSTGLLELTGEADWTVILASHDVEETERLSDRVGILHAGQLLLEGGVEELMQAHQQVTVRFETPPSAPPANGIFNWQVEGSVAGFVDPDYDPQRCREKLATLGKVKTLEARPLSLREIFVVRAKAKRRERG